MGSRRRIEAWLARLPWYRREERDAELERELRDHIELEADEQRAAGLPAEEAANAAHRALGNTLKIEEDVRAAWGLQRLETFAQDVRYALRTLRKSPGFAAVAVLTLALGIGANTAIFSIVDAVLLRPLPFKDPSRLVMLWEGIPAIGFSKVTASAPDIMFYEGQQKSFDAIGAFQNKAVDISGGAGEPERVIAARVSASIFPMLGVSPLIGRTYTDAEDKSRANVVVLSYGLWRRRYGADRNIVGKSVAIDRVPYTVLGVMPKSFVFPLNGPKGSDEPADLWAPMAFTQQELTNWGNQFNYNVLGCLKSGVTVAQAQTEANLIAGRLVQAYPGEFLKTFPNFRIDILLFPFHEEVVGSVQTLLLVLMAAVGLVLLIVCANVATLLLSRAASRCKEIAIRTALGASRMRLVRQMLTESLVLALAGGALGVLIAFWGTKGLLALVPASIPLPPTVPMGGPVLAFVAAACCATAVVFGVAPAFQISAGSLHGSLQEGGRSGTPCRARRRLQDIFVTAEFALALVLLIGAGLLVRSFTKLLAADLGFRPDHILTMNVPLPRKAYPKAANVREFYEQALQRISALPGVKDDGISSDLPFHGNERDVVQLDGTPGKTPSVSVSMVFGDYLSTMGIGLLRGRDFTPEDRAGSQLVALVSEGAAETLWPGEDALGKRFNVLGQSEVVVGVVTDVSEDVPTDKPQPHVYVPYMQLPGVFLEGDNQTRAMNIAVRTTGDPAALTSAATGEIYSLDPDLAIARIHTMNKEVSESVAGPRFNTSLLAIFSVAALFLAAIGIYGVLAYAVAQQTHEIGVRIALGAQRRDVMRLVLAHGAWLALVGIAIGLLAALGLTRLMASLLYGISASDPLTFAAVSLVLFVVALLACYIPARRAMRVDPMVALRYE